MYGLIDRSVHTYIHTYIYNMTYGAVFIIKINDLLLYTCTYSMYAYWYLSIVRTTTFGETYFEILSKSQ